MLRADARPLLPYDLPVEQHWNRILAWVEQHAPDLLDHLEPGAERAELAEAETRLSMRLPTALRTFYTLQNGTVGFAIFPALEPDQSAFGPLAVDEIEFLEIDEDDDSGEMTEDDFDADPGIRREFWNEMWIPFAAAGDRGDFLILDMAPDRGGRPGQVIEWRHDTNERRLVAPSLEHLLKQVAEGMEAGRYVYDEEAGVRRTERA
jgi:cell wall assembly regulator SMI1